MDNLMKAALAEGSYVAFTDGSCKPNPGPGGCAYRLYSPDGEMTEASRESLSTTNNIAEMRAVIDALGATPIDASVLVCLDSGYIKDGFEKYLAGWIKRNWRKSDGSEVANQELWKKIIELTDTRKVTLHKVKAHTGDPDNERVDTLAGEAADRAGERVLSALRRGYS